MSEPVEISQEIASWVKRGQLSFVYESSSETWYALWRGNVTKSRHSFLAVLADLHRVAGKGFVGD